MIVAITRPLGKLLVSRRHTYSQESVSKPVAYFDDSINNIALALENIHHNEDYFAKV